MLSRGGGAAWRRHGHAVPALTGTPPGWPRQSRCWARPRPARSRRSAPSVPTTTARTRSPTRRPDPRSTHALARRPRAPGGPRGRCIEVLVLGRLDQHLDLGADAVLGALGHQLLDERGDPLDPRGDLVGGRACRRSSRPRCRPRRSSRRRRPRRAGRRSRNASSSATSSSVSPGKPTITLLRMPASGASARMRAQQVEEGLAASRSAASGAARSGWRAGRTGRSRARRPVWSAMASSRPGRISAGCR